MKILTFYGTRPEFLKVIPIINRLQNNSLVEHYTINTGQHKEMVLDLELYFNHKADFYLDIMEPNQSLNKIVSKVINTVDKLLDNLKPDWVLVQGDTSTVLSVATAAFNRGIKVAHVEAGLRSNNIHSPFPEEFNRRVVSLIANLNFAPTELSKLNLIKEGVANNSIFVVGNTIIDTLKIVKTRLKNFQPKYKQILVTAHRRENHANGILEICNAIKKLHLKFPDLVFLWPTHPNPNVKTIVEQELLNLSYVKLTPPLNYTDLLQAISDSVLIWTDSGGIQEEAPEFNKPILILRDETERPEVIECGIGILVGANTEKIVSESSELLSNKKYYESIQSIKNPFGKGDSSFLIEQILVSNG